MTTIVKPSTFSAYGKVCVVDMNYPLEFFYKKNFHNPGKFNLPVGTYKIYGDVTKDKEFTCRIENVLPDPERVGMSILEGDAIFVEYGDNPNKASIFKSEGRILKDHSLKKMSRAINDFIFFHELGHYYYATESYCDAFAHVCMMQSGYNYSQVREATEKSGLHDAERLNDNYENIKKIQGKK